MISDRIMAIVNAHVFSLRSFMEYHSETSQNNRHTNSYMLHKRALSHEKIYAKSDFEACFLKLTDNEQSNKSLL